MNARCHYNISQKQIHITAAIQYTMVNNNSARKFNITNNHKIYQNSIFCSFKLAISFL